MKPRDGDDAIRELDSLSNRSRGCDRSRAEYRFAGNEYMPRPKQRHAAHIGFYVFESVERAPFPVWPPDFDPADVERYANEPPAPEVIECEHCRVRAMCRPGQWAKAKCAERKEYKLNRRSRADTAVIVLATLRRGPLTIYELCDAMGDTYDSVRVAVANLVKSGAIRCVDRRPNNNLQGGSGGKVYAVQAQGE